jgi:hypothetical protein
VPGYDFNPLINTGNYSNSYFAPYQGYNAITYYTSFGKSSWNAFLVPVKHPVGNNLYLTLAYTWSHNLTNMNAIQSDNNLQSNYGNSSLNTPHVLTFSLIYTEPWLKNSTGWKRQVLSGWKLSDMTTVQSGSSSTLGLGTSHNGLPPALTSLARLRTPKNCSSGSTQNRSRSRPPASSATRAMERFFPLGFGFSTRPLIRTFG